MRLKPREPIRDATLAGISVTLGYDEIEQKRVTDEGGVVEFAPIPMDAVERLAVRVALHDA